MLNYIVLKILKLKWFSKYYYIISDKNGLKNLKKIDINILIVLKNIF